MSLTRLACPGVVPLQVWDLDVGSGQKFWEVVGARVVSKLLQEHSPTEAACLIASGIVRGCTVLQRQYDFDTVFLAGGGSELLGLQAVLVAPPMWMFGGRDYAATAKEAVFGNEPMVTVDVGQTAVKCYATPGAAFIIERDLETLPFGEIPGKKERTVRFLGDAIKQAMTMLPQAPLLLSLPMPVDDFLVPGESTYGVAGSVTFVDELLVEADVPSGTQVYVINDAELAAECARVHLPEGRKVLVLTLGLGPGAALIST